jgi:translation initiation factor 2B subunit (eIF-2B alpha/beta/delta family)
MVSSTVSPTLSRAPSSSSSQLDPELEEAVVKEFLELLHSDEPSGDSISMPVAGVKVLIGVIRRSKAATVMGMERELRQTADALLNSVKLHSKSTIALSSGCELFLRYVTRCSLDFPDFDDCKLQVLQRGEKFAEMSVTSRLRIAELGHGFVRDGAVVMTHGYSRVVTSLLVRAAKVSNCLLGYFISILRMFQNLAVSRVVA